MWLHCVATTCNKETTLGNKICPFPNAAAFNIRITYVLKGDCLLFKHKSDPPPNLQIDLGDLEKEKENLTNFLILHLRVSVIQEGDKIGVNSENLSLQGLAHMVNKFVYHRDLNRTHWVSTEGSTVKINRFEVHHKKKEKHDNEPPHQTLVQSWGL